MEEFLSENLSTIVLLLFGLVLILLSALVGVLLYVVLRDRRNKEEATTATKVEVVDKQDDKYKVNLDSLKAQQSSAYCENHPDVAGVGTCAICENVFCEKCLMEYEHLRFCPEHFRTYTNHKWVHITNVKTTPTETENAMPIYHFKKLIWENDDIPTFIQTDYKINVEGDFVESYVKLFVREEDQKKLENRLSNFKVH